ncbi:MAG TPA: PRC-barrel domain-containing protein [Verrucomicrobiae bacterium]|jgi:sporulation protein YlmC with PRC-barrel domain
MKKSLTKISLLGLAAALAQFTVQAQNAPSANSPSSTLNKSVTTTDTNTISKSGTSNTATTTANSSSTFMASKVLGAKVKSSSGENIGQLEDFVLDPASGQVRLAVLGVGGFLGIGEKKTPVPWKALSATTEKDFTLNIDRSKLQSAPTIDKDQTANWATPDFVTQVYTYYGVDLPSGVGATGAAVGTETGTEIKKDSSDLKDKLKDKTDELKDDFKRTKDQIKDKFSKSNP